MSDIDEATDRVIAGPAKSGKVISKKERNIVAFHEAGHVVIGLTLDDAEIVHKVTIVPRGQAGGYAVMLPKEDRYFMTKPELLDKIAGLLGGRVAEDITFGEVSTGAHNDFQRATGIVRRMVTEYGMSDKLGPMQFGQAQGGNVFLGRDFNSEQNYSDAIAYEIDQEMQTMIKEQYERTKQILTERRELLNLIANTLLRSRNIRCCSDQTFRRAWNTSRDDLMRSKSGTEVNLKKEEVADAVGAPADPTTGDLPKEEGTAEHTRKSNSRRTKRLIEYES